MGITYKTITAIIELKSGTRVGGSGGQMGIGGVEDNLRILRDPGTKYPYLPGSSLKGKVRNLLELQHGRKDRYGNAATHSEPCMCGRCLVCRVFGPHKNTQHQLGPSRLLVRDAYLTPESEEALKEINAEIGVDSVEVKTENIINRITGTAEHPRTGERALRGLQFQLRLSVRILDEFKDNEKEILDLIDLGFHQMLPKDAIGSSGSRGYGEIEVKNWTVE